MSRRRPFNGGFYSSRSWQLGFLGCQEETRWQEVVAMIIIAIMVDYNHRAIFIIVIIRYQAVLHLTEERRRQDHGLTLDSGIYVSRF